MTERYTPNENLERTKGKIRRNLKAILGEVLRFQDFYMSTVVRPLALRKQEIPADYTNRDLIDIGSGSGERYAEISYLFNPKSYMGVDHDPREVKAGKIKFLDIKHLDFISEDLKGDLGVAFGTHMSPEIAQKLIEGFNSLIFNNFAQTKEDAEKLIKRYEDQLGTASFEKIVKVKRPLIRGSGYEIYFFLKARRNSDENQQS